MHKAGLNLHAHKTVGEFRTKRFTFAVGRNVHRKPVSDFQITTAPRLSIELLVLAILAASLCGLDPSSVFEKS
jgi:hypothetical protein